jgi:protein TonB
MSAIVPRTEPLAAERSFRRILALSLGGHALFLVLVLWTPFFSLASSRPAAVVVSIVSDLPAPPPPPAPEPPQPEAAPPPPEATPPPPEPRQQIEEAFVIPPVPREKPPRAKPEPKPEPTASAADIMSQLRQSYEPIEPQPNASAETPGAAGLVDRELAAYQRAVTKCIQTNFVGGLQYLRRRDIEVGFDITLEVSGAIRDYRVSRSSGDRQFDSIAARALERCKTSLPPPPGGRTRLPIAFTPAVR